MENTIKTKISIIIPVYNMEKYLQQALDSACNQTLQDIEIICIDNCSNDGSKEILREYEKRDHRINVIYNSENKGCSYSRNIGLREAKGEYIIFLDADDELKTDAAEISYFTAKEERLDILFFQVSRQYENENLKQEYGYIYDASFESINIFTGMQIFSELIEKSSYALTLWGKLFRRNFLMEKGFVFHENILHEDVPFTFCAVLAASRTKVISEELYIYRKRDGSLTTSEKQKDGFYGWLAGYCDMLRYWMNYQNVFDGQVSEKIDIFLSGMYRMLANSAPDKEEIAAFTFQNPFENHIYKTLLMERCLLSEHQRHMIKGYSKVILYGAGKIAGELLKEIDDERILGIAVTDTHINAEEKNGYAIRKISDYREYKEEALIIVAVTEKFHKAIKETLEQEGFRNVMYII